MIRLASYLHERVKIQILEHVSYSMESIRVCDLRRKVKSKFTTKEDRKWITCSKFTGSRSFLSNCNNSSSPFRWWLFRKFKSISQSSSFVLLHRGQILLAVTPKWSRQRHLCGLSALNKDNLTGKCTSFFSFTTYEDYYYYYYYYYYYHLLLN